MPKNVEPPEKLYKDLKVKVTASVEDAVRSLSELKRQVTKLGDMSDQGKHQQRGFLSKRQVQVYKQIYKEIEQKYQEHVGNLEKIQQDYLNRRKKYDDEYNKADDAVRYAKKTGLPDEEIKRREKIRNEAQAKADSVVSPELDKKLAQAEETLQKLEARKQQASSYKSSMDDMNVRDPMMRDAASGAIHVATKAGAVLSLAGLEHYVGGGIGGLRHEEQRGALLGQKLGSSYGGDDAQMRIDALKTGEKNQYNPYETLTTQWAMVRAGGTNGDKKQLANDTESVQSLSRAYSLDPTDVAYSSGSLKKIGALKDGEMQKFANLIGGSVAKNGMRGREEELLHATTSLIASVGQGQTTMTSEKVGNIVSMQTDVGQASPALKGEAGAQLLSGFDQMSKNAGFGGSNQLDLLMGKGTAFQGKEGYNKLKRLQQRGISDPEVMKLILGGFDRIGMTNTDDQDNFISQQSGGKITMDQVSALRKAGILDKWKKGENLSGDDQKTLKQLGMADESKQLSMRDNSNTKTIESNEMNSHNVQNSASKPFSRIGQGIGDAYNQLPFAARVGMPFIGGIGGALFAGTMKSKLMSSKLGDMFTKMFRGKAGTADAMGNAKWKPLSEIFETAKGGIGGLFSKFKGGGGGTGGIGGTGGFFSKLTGGISSLASHLKPSNLLSSMGKIWSNANIGGANLTKGVSSLGGSLADSAIGKTGISAIMKNLSGGALKWGGKALSVIGKRAPIVGTALGIGLDRVQNPNTSWGRSIFKGVGGALGGALGLAGAGALGLGTGGLGLAAAGGLAVGGSMAGDKLGDSLYSGIFGSKDKQNAQQIDTQKDLNKLSTSDNSNSVPGTDDSKVDTLSVDKLNIKDSDFSRYVDKTKSLDGNSKDSSGTTSDISHGLINSALGNVSKDYNLKITVDGNVEGMTSSNQTSITDSITGFFQNLLSPKSGVNLSTAQKFR